MNPKVHILLATYNRSHLLPETLDSILNQTYTHWKCIIVDDNSEDNTSDVIREYQKRDSRFSYFLKREEYKKGLSGTRNYSLDIALEKGANFIQFFDDDDIMHPRKLELQINPLLQDETLDLSICCYRKFTDKNIIEFDLDRANDNSCNIKTNNLTKAFFTNQINLNSLGPLWRARKLKSYRFNEDLNYAEEGEFYSRIFLNEELKHYPVNEILFWYRKHPEALTSTFYKDSSVVSEALKLNKKLIFREVLRQPSAPFYLLKNYVRIGEKRNELSYLKGVKNYLLKKNRLFSIRNLVLFLYLVWVEWKFNFK